MRAAMERTVVRIALLGLLLTFVSTLPNKDDWDIYSFHINSTVSGRYATTVITSRVANRVNATKEIEFQVRIPKNAFISKFTMFIDGVAYDGVVKAKEEAQEQYMGAVTRGESAGIISSVGRTLEEFKTSVAVAAHKKVTFELTYEELLTRKHGKYELQIHARPMQPVRDFKVDVHISEKAGINFLKVKGGLSENVMASAVSKRLADNQAWVYFYPTEVQQKTCSNCGKDGMNGDLVVVYDVNRGASLGDIKKSDGYFVHHFAPSDLPRIPKNVVFVIDRSGSMHGRKMEQTRIALIHILTDLAEEDFFGLVTFDSTISYWKRELVQATAENLKSAKTFARNIVDRGATDINAAVLEGARMLNANPREGSASILILLTDGDPTTGVTNPEEIQGNVRRAIAKKFPLYCLGFGFDVNFEFLEKMSLQNTGVARRIYEDSDADLQLQGFYEEVATPLLTDVTMIYTGVTNVTQSNFSQYYNGSEIVVAGQIDDNDIDTFVPEVVAISVNTRVVFSETDSPAEPTETSTDSQLQRVWAYLTVKQLLDKELQLSGPEKAKAKNEALELSLKYSFVTPLTSMVVTKPPGERMEVLHKPKEGERSNPRGSAGPHGTSRLSTPPMAGQVPIMGYAGLPGIAPTQRARKRGRQRISITQATRNLPRPDFHIAASPPLFSDVMFAEPDDYEAAVFPVRPTHAPPRHRFLLETGVQSPPLCFDVTGQAVLQLLHHPSGEVIVKGELDSLTNGGFRKIVVRFQGDHRISIDTSDVIVRVGQGPLQLVTQDPLVLGSLTVIKRNHEIDITAGDTRIVIFRHTKDGQAFLWPVVRQHQVDGHTAGLLAQKAVYEEVRQSPSTVLRINGREISVTRSTAVDYSMLFPATLDCWLMSADDALQRSLGDFFLAGL